MMRTPEKSSSVPDVSALGSSTPPNYISSRFKRKRVDEVTIDKVQEMTLNIKNDMTEIINKMVESQNSQINTILTALKEIHHTSSAIQTTITYLSEENTELKAKLEKMEIQSKKDREQIILLENKLEENQRIERKSNIEIRNVPLNGKEKKKDLLQMVLTLAETLEVKLQRSEIKDIIKTKKQKQEGSTIIVELTNTIIKTDILKSSKDYNMKNKSNKLCAKHLGLNTHPDVLIFISENLTPHSSRLYFLARDFKTANNYKYCWTSYGKVYLRCDDDSPIVNITKAEQLQQLLKE